MSVDAPKWYEQFRVPEPANRIASFRTIIDHGDLHVEMPVPAFDFQDGLSEQNPPLYDYIEEKKEADNPVVVVQDGNLCFAIVNNDVFHPTTVQEGCVGSYGLTLAAQNRFDQTTDSVFVLQQPKAEKTTVQVVILEGQLVKDNAPFKIAIEFVPKS